jgi:hypothetical protein
MSRYFKSWALPLPRAVVVTATAVVAIALLSTRSSGAPQDSNSTLPSSSFSRGEVGIARPAQSAGVQKVVTHYHVVKLGTLGGVGFDANNR